MPEDEPEPELADVPFDDGEPLSSDAVVDAWEDVHRRSSRRRSPCPSRPSRANHALSSYETLYWKRSEGYHGRKKQERGERGNFVRHLRSSRSTAGCWTKSSRWSQHRSTVRSNFSGTPSDAGVERPCRRSHQAVFGSYCKFPRGRQSAVSQPKTSQFA